MISIDGHPILFCRASDSPRLYLNISKFNCIFGFWINNHFIYFFIYVNLVIISPNVKIFEPATVFCLVPDNQALPGAPLLTCIQVILTISIAKVKKPLFYLARPRSKGLGQLYLSQIKSINMTVSVIIKVQQQLKISWGLAYYTEEMRERGNLGKCKTIICRWLGHDDSRCFAVQLKFAEIPRTDWLIPFVFSSGYVRRGSMNRPFRPAKDQPEPATPPRTDHAQRSFPSNHYATSSLMRPPFRPGVPTGLPYDTI